MKKEILIIFILTLIQGIAHNLAHPITPSYVSYLGIDDVMFGVFFASMSLGIVFGSPVWGILSDKGNHKRWLIVGNIMYALGQLLYGYSENVSWMMIARIFSGFGAASGITIFAALILIYSKKNQVGKNLALFGGSLTLGSSLGYFIGGQLSNFQVYFNQPSYQYVFMIQSVLTLLYVFSIYLFIKNPSTIKEDSFVPFYRHVMSIFKMPFYQWLFYFGLLLATMSFTFVSKYIDVYFRDLGYAPNILGTFVLFTGFISLITSLVIVPILFKIRSKSTFFILTIIGSTALWMTFQFSQILISLYTIFSIYVVSKTAHQPFEQTHISTFATHDYGRVMGIRQLFIGLGMILGPILGSIIYTFNRKLSFEVASIIIMLSMIFMVISIKKNKVLI